MWVGGRLQPPRRAGSRLLSCPPRTPLQGRSPAAAESCGSLTRCSRTRKRRQPPRPGQGPSLGEGPADGSPQRWDRHRGGVSCQVQSSPTASPRHVQVQICLGANFSSACFSAVPRISSKPGLTLLATEKIVLTTEHLSLPVC